MKYLLAVIILVGCGTSEIIIDAGPVPIDSSAMPDSGDFMEDSGSPMIDSGPSRPDSGPPRSDSGVPPVLDSGPPPIDGGPPPTDSGPPPPAPSPAVQVAAGSNHTCARRMDGTVFCWGYPGSALGHGRSTDSLSAVQAMGITDARDISAGGRHTCAAQGGAGNVDCWGDNNYGQIGTGSTSMYELTPTRIPSARGSIGLALGEDHTCLLNDMVSVVLGQCWGRNHRRQLGNPAVTAPVVASPILVDGIGTDSIDIESYGDRTCVLRSDTSIWCWGNGAAPAMERFGTDLAVGGSHLCTVTGGATSLPSCWGDNSYGQLGSFTAFSGPWAVDAVAGEHHSCAIYDDGSAQCWGRNQRGQLGNGSAVALSSSPVVAIASGVVDLSAGPNHTCAVLASGETRCWGDNAFGQLGNGTRTMSRSPVTVIGL